MYIGTVYQGKLDSHSIWALLAHSFRLVASLAVSKLRIILSIIFGASVILCQKLLFLHYTIL